MNAKADEYLDALLQLPPEVVLRALAESLTVEIARRMDVGPVDSHTRERFDTNQQIAASTLLTKAQVIAAKGGLA